MNFRVHFKSFLEHEFSVVQIENVFKVNDKSYVFFGLGVFSQATEHNSARPIQHPFWYLYLLVDFCILLDVIKRHEIWLILRTIFGKYCLQRQNKVLNRGFLAQSNSYQKMTVVVRKVFFFKNHIQKICQGSKKIKSSSPVRLGSQIFQCLGASIGASNHSNVWENTKKYLHYSC